MKRILEGSQKSLLTVSLMAAFLTLSACGSDDDDIGSGVGDNVVAPVDGDADGDGVADGDTDGDTGGDGDTGADSDADADGDADAELFRWWVNSLPGVLVAILMVVKDLTLSSQRTQ